DLAIEEWIRADHERACPQLNQGREGRIDSAFRVGMQDMELKPEGAGRALRVSGGGLGKSRTGRVDEQGNMGGRADQVVQPLQPLRHYLHVQCGYTRDVGTRSRIRNVAQRITLPHGGPSPS